MSSTLQAVTAAVALTGSYIPPQVHYPEPASNQIAVPRWEIAAASHAKSNLLKSSPVSADYFNSRLPESCYYPLEVLIIQDSTYSFADDFPTMINSELDQMYDGIMAKHPGSTFAVASHTDKPITPFGWPETETTYGDWCWRIEQPLSGERADLTATYNNMIATGGYDLPENQYGCIVNAVQSKKIGWGTNPDATRLVVLSTDAPPHYEGDGNSQQNMTNFSGVFDEANADEQCVKEFYPSPQQAIDNALDTSNGIPPYFAFVVFDGGDLPNNQTIGSWQWYASQIKEDSRFVRDRTADSDNFWEQLSSIIGVMDSLECQGTTSTSTSTEAVTTAPPSTVSSDSTVTEPTKLTTTEPTTTELTTTASSTSSTSISDPKTRTSTGTTESTTGGKCPCPSPCPEPCDCKCGNSVYLRYPKSAKNVDLHIDYRI